MDYNIKYTVRVCLQECKYDIVLFALNCNMPIAHHSLMLIPVTKIFVA
jgi:hypothetical protein